MSDAIAIAIREARSDIETCAFSYIDRAEHIARAAAAKGASDIRASIVDECPACVGGCYAAARALGALVASCVLDGTWRASARQGCIVDGDVAAATDLETYRSALDILAAAQARAVNRKNAAARAAEIIRAMHNSLLCGATARVEVDGCTVDIEVRTSTTRVTADTPTGEDELTAMAIALACMGWAEDMEVSADGEYVTVEIGSHGFFEYRATHADSREDWQPFGEGDGPIM
jgi:hypothetical protein